MAGPLSVEAAVKKKPAARLTVSAIPGADEKNFANPTTRCLTPAMKTLNASMVKRMKADIADAEKRLGKKFEPIVEAPVPVESIVERKYCSSEKDGPVQVCIAGPLAAGMPYRAEFQGFAGHASDMIVIAPMQNGVSSPSMSVQADMTGSLTTGSTTFEGLPVGTYTAYGFTNLNGTDRATAPLVSVAFTVEASAIKTMVTPSVAAAPVVLKKTPADIYKDKMDTVWAAMAEPYCGYGSRGITAVKKSFSKSVEHIRAEFLKATTPVVAKVAPKVVTKK